MRSPVLGMALSLVAAAEARASVPFFAPTCAVGSDGETIAAFGIQVYSRRVIAIGGEAALIVYDGGGHVVSTRSVHVARTLLQRGHTVLGSVDIPSSSSGCILDLRDTVEIRRPRLTPACAVKGEALEVSIRNDGDDRNDWLELHGLARVDAAFKADSMPQKSFDIYVDADIAPGATATIATLPLGPELRPAFDRCTVDVDGALR